jgi:tetratricopeptide (TPR) repeat protein
VAGPAGIGEDESARSARSPPRRIGRYELEEELGRGGMGAVYRALDPLLKRYVAVKVLRPDPSSDVATQEEWCARMLREARAAAAFSHPNAIAVYDVGIDEGAPFIAMELAPGKTLRHFVGDPAVAIEQRVRWLAAIARALGAAHRIGIVHRDVKPDNVMVTPEGAIKILDFGIAKWSSETSAAPLPTLTAAGMILGTPQYMAPEQIRGEALDGRVDQYAWGVVAYELLTGRPMYPKATEPMRLIASILTSVTPPASTVAPSVPLALSEVVEKALAKKPGDRFADMDAVADALDAAFRGEPGRPASTQPSRATHGVRRTGAWRVAAVALSALVVGGAGAGLVVWQHGRAHAGAPADRVADPAGTIAVAILEFENQTRRSEDDWLKTGLADALAAKLGSAGGVEVTANANIVVVGSFQKVGNEIRIAARAQEAREPHRVLASSEQRGTMEQIFDLQDALAFALADKLGAPPARDAQGDDGSGRQAIRRPSGTRNLEAFEAFNTGRSLLLAGRVPEAMRAFDRAVAADPEYRDARATLNRVRAEQHHFLVKDDGTVLETISEAVQGDPKVPWMLTTDSGTLTRAWDLDGNALGVERVAASGNNATFRVAVGPRANGQARGIVYELESASKEKQADGLSVLFHSVAKSTSGETTFIVQLPPHAVPLAVIPTAADRREDASGTFLVLHEARGAFAPYAFSVVHASDPAAIERFAGDPPADRARWIATADPRMNRHGWAADLSRIADVGAACRDARGGSADEARATLARIQSNAAAYDAFFVARAELCVADAAHDERAAAAAIEAAIVAPERPAPLVPEAYLDAIAWYSARKRIADMAGLVRREHQRAPWFSEKPFETRLPAGDELAALRQKLDREPGNVAAAYDLALALYQAKRYEEAERALQSADAFLGGVYVAELRARIAVARGDDESAAADLRKLVMFYPMTWAWTAHAVLLASADRADEALALVAKEAPATDYDPPVFWALRYVVGVLPHPARYTDRIVDLVRHARETQYGQPYRLDRLIDLIEVASLSLDPEGPDLAHALFARFETMVRDTSPEACGEACLQRLGAHLCRVRALTAAERDWIGGTLGRACE